MILIDSDDSSPNHRVRAGYAHEVGADAPTQGSKGRTRTLAYALLGAYVSKVGSFVMTLVGLPLAARSLPADSFATLAAFWVIVAWTGFFNPLVGPATGLAIATSLTRPDGAAEAHATARGALGAGLVVSLILGGVAGLAGPTLLGLTSIASIAVAVGVSFLTSYLAIGEGVRTGFHRAHKNGVWAGVGTLFGAAFIAVVFVSEGSVLFFAAGIFLLPLAIRSAAFALEFAHLATKPAAVGIRWSRLAQRNAYHIGTVQMGSLGGFPLAMLIVIRAHPDQAGSLFVTQAVGSIVLGLLAGVFEPFGAASADALGRGDVAWLARASRAIRLSCVAASAVAVLGAITVAPIATSALYGAESPSRLSLGLIGMAAGPAAAFGLYYQLVLGMGSTRGAAKAVVPGYILGAIISAAGASVGNNSIVVAGAMLVPSVVGLTQLAPQFGRNLARQRTIASDHGPTSTT